MSSSSDDGSDHGMFEVYCADDPTIEYIPALLLFRALTNLRSIIAVHGLFGHHKTSWTLINSENGSETYWLRDLLPVLVPQARVLSFGYRSDYLTANILSCEGIDKACIRFLEIIAELRSYAEVNFDNFIIVFGARIES